MIELVRAVVVAPGTIPGVSNRLHLRFFLQGRHLLCDRPAFSEKRERLCAGCYCRDCRAGVRSRIR